MSHRCVLTRLLAVGFLLVVLAGCSDDMISPDSGTRVPAGFGATQGGVQDMGLARELVANGYVPPVAAFTVEGIFSEHDLPLDGPVAPGVLNLRGALGTAPDRRGAPCGWLQVGLSSNIDPEAFARPSQSIVACVDVSGSMGWFYGTETTEYPPAGLVARWLLERITGQLDGSDRVAVVTYGSDVRTLLEPVAADSPAVADAIGQLSADGSTNMEAGLRRAFAVAESERQAGTDAVRVLLFSDIQPNVGATSGGSFREMAAAAAAEGIGLTVFGLGVGLGQDVMNAIADLRGGNGYSLFDGDDVNALVEENWPWVVTPIAHELTLDLEVPDGLRVEACYGFPGGPDGAPGLAVASVFPSRRKGALLVRMASEDGLTLAGRVVTGHLSYRSLSGASRSQNLTWTFPNDSGDATETWFDQPAVGRTVALALLVEGMIDAAEVYGENQEAAVAIMQVVTTRIVAEAATDPNLAPEATLATDLLALMEAGAEQGDMYGHFGP